MLSLSRRRRVGRELALCWHSLARRELCILDGGMYEYDFMAM